MEPFDLDKPILTFSSAGLRTTFWTIRDAVEGVQIFGGIGSGKTSGSGKTIAEKFLRAGFGGLVLTAKPDEKEIWIDYCRRTNRSGDLIHVTPGGRHSFNFLDYISQFATDDLPLTDNVVQVLKTVIEASADKASGQTDDPFWENSLDLLLINVIDLCQLAYKSLSLDKLYMIASTAPKKDTKPATEGKVGSYAHAIGEAHRIVKEAIDAIVEGLTPEEQIKFSDQDYAEAYFMDHMPGYSTLTRVDTFFSETLVSISEKTRAIIELCFTGFLSRLLKEPVYSLFCKGKSNFTPDDCLKGKIILLDLPVKKYQKVGRDTQIMFKYIWQLAMERRNVRANSRPVFLFADEAQNFLHSHDADYQATARSSRIATVYISQNLPNYHANMGGSKSHYKVQSFLGTLGTKIFHANADIETNRYASELIGDAYVEDISRSSTVSGEFSSGRSSSFKLERMVRPEQFHRMATGGPLKGYVVEAIMHLQSKQFSNDLNHRKVRFSQENQKT